MPLLSSSRSPTGNVGFKPIDVSTVTRGKCTAGWQPQAELLGKRRMETGGPAR
jgi:hypothetical protein